MKVKKKITAKRNSIQRDVTDNMKEWKVTDGPLRRF